MFSFQPDPSEIQFTAVRSRGPGGQNVNKVSSAALLKWDFMNSADLPIEAKLLIQKNLAGYINKAGLLYLRSDEYRDLERNKSRCLDKLSELLKRAFFKPKPRRKTKPTRASRRKRLDDKKHRGEIKKSRKVGDY